MCRHRNAHVVKDTIPEIIAKLKVGTICIADLKDNGRPPGYQMRRLLIEKTSELIRPAFALLILFWVLHVHVPDRFVL